MVLSTEASYTSCEMQLGSPSIQIGLHPSLRSCALLAEIKLKSRPIWYPTSIIQYKIRNIKTIIRGKMFPSCAQGWGTLGQMGTGADLATTMWSKG